MSDPGSVQVTLPRWAGIAAAAFALGMIALLATQIVLLEDQRRTVRTQRAIAQRQIREALPVLEAVRPLLGGARAAQPALRETGGRIDRLTRAATPLVTDLRAARAGDAARATIALANDLLGADVGRATASVERIAAVTDDLGPALRELRDRDLLRRAAVAADTVPKLDPTLRESLRIQRQTLRIQRETLAVLQQSLAIQRGTEQHAESLDRKTGGTAPPTAAPAPLP
jgi:hypothetical protein